MHGSRILIVVRPEHTAVQAVEYALREIRDSEAELGTSIEVDVRILDRDGDSSAAHRTETRIEDLVSTFGRDDQLYANVDILQLDSDDEGDSTDSLLDSIDTRDISRLIVAADSELSVERLRDSLGVTRVELAPTDAPRERRRLIHPGGVRRFVTVFGVTYLFYLAVGGFAGGLDILTGAVSAGVVALALSHVALGDEPTLRRTGGRLGRMVVFLPVLLWEIVKANFVIAYIILHPRLPIDPSMGVHETDTRDDLERMVLASSITLTPGTLTIDVSGRDFTIHSLTPEARTGLEGGRLQRLVSWVFHGSGRTLPSNDEGGDER